MSLAIFTIFGATLIAFAALSAWHCFGFVSVWRNGIDAGCERTDQAIQRRTGHRCGVGYEADNKRAGITNRIAGSNPATLTTFPGGKPSTPLYSRGRRQITPPGMLLKRNPRLMI